MDNFIGLSVYYIRMKVEGFRGNIYILFYFFRVFSSICKCSVKGTFDFHFSSSPSSPPSLRLLLRPTRGHRRRGEKGRTKQKSKWRWDEWPLEIIRKSHIYIECQETYIGWYIYTNNEVDCGDMEMYSYFSTLRTYVF